MAGRGSCNRSSKSPGRSRDRGPGRSRVRSSRKSIHNFLRAGSKLFDPTRISCYGRKVPQERLRARLQATVEYGQPGPAAASRCRGRFRPGWSRKARGSNELAAKIPDLALFLRRAGIIASAPARFSTLEGYAGRNQRNGVGFSPDSREDARPPSRFSSESGTKADAKHLGFCAFGWAEDAVQNQSGPKGTRLRF